MSMEDRSEELATMNDEQGDQALSPADDFSETEETLLIPLEDYPAADQEAAWDDESHLQVLKSATIMMVDDEPITTEVIQTFLDDEGYTNFVTTDQSTEALDLLDKHRPDIVLLDLMMPEVSGFDILTAMRANPELKQIPAIVLTSATDGDTKLKALELGAADFLAKPVDPSELALRLRNTLAAKAYRSQLAYHDALTGLPTRGMFLDLLGWALKRAQRCAMTAALLHVDIDHFQQINDKLGLKAGDELLRELAQRLAQCVRASDAVGSPGGFDASKPMSRLSGDKFVALLPEIGDVENAAAVARRVLAAFAEPALVDEHEVSITCSIGVALFPDDGESPEHLIKLASLATFRAKQDGRGIYRFCSEKLNAGITESSKLESALPQALTRDELVLHFQPIVNIKSQRVPAVEALLRWNHPELGVVCPDEFLRQARETGLIVQIGEWVLHEACKQNKAWQSAGLATLAVSVNIAAQQLRTGQLTKTVRDALEHSGLDPQYLTLEFKENTLMESAERDLDLLREVKEMGVKISVDDFGTGYSSLSLLKRFPVDELKIDCSLFAGGGMDADDAAMISAIIAVAHNLGMKVVAEGVESKRQWDFLKRKKCDQCQGFLFSKPCSADALSARIVKPKQRADESPAIAH